MNLPVASIALSAVAKTNILNKDPKGWYGFAELDKDPSLHMTKVLTGERHGLGREIVPVNPSMIDGWVQAITDRQPLWTLIA